MIPCCLLTAALLAQPTANWAGFRGDGSSRTTATLPLSWSESEQIAWRVKLPGYGQSSPVLRGKRLFVTAVEGEEKERLLVLCHDLTSGKELWRRSFPASQRTKSSDYVSKAAPTAVVDEQRVYVFFESGDLLALDHQGDVVWQRSLTKEFGEFQGNHGVGTSLVRAADRLILLVDHAGPSYLLACETATGKSCWKIDRPERVSWSTPLFIAEPTPQIVISSNGIAECFDWKDGKRLWYLDGLQGNTVASPTAAGKQILIASSTPSQSLLLKPGQDRLGEDQIQCHFDEATSSFASPLVHADRAYFVNKAGVAYAADLQTGKTIWTLRLPDSCWASPIGAADRVYFFAKGGTTVVVRAADQLETLAENKLPTEGRVYGVAATDGAIVIRTGNELICVGKTK